MGSAARSEGTLIEDGWKIQDAQAACGARSGEPFGGLIDSSNFHLSSSRVEFASAGLRSLVAQDRRNRIRAENDRGLSVLERVLQVGNAYAWMPTDEAGTDGTGTLCSHGVQNGIYNRSHEYLPFAKNGINSVASQGEDVISYNFTGCIMAVFTHQGVRKVCHVSTGAGQDCKGEWDRVKGTVNVFEFRPSDFIDTGGGAFACCYGLITSDLQTLAIAMVRSKTHAITVASIKKAHLRRD